MIIPCPQLVVIGGTIMAASSIEAIGPIQEQETHAAGWLMHTFWVTTSSGAYQWKGEKFLDTSDATGEQQGHAEECEKSAELARAALIAAVWPGAGHWVG